MAHLAAALCLAAGVLAAAPARAAEIEPRAYLNTPVGMNFVIAGYVYSEGGLSTDPASPLQDAKLKINTGLFAYARTLNLWGKSGKIDVVLPYSDLSGTATGQGRAGGAARLRPQRPARPPLGQLHRRARAVEAGVRLLQAGPHRRGEPPGLLAPRPVRPRPPGEPRHQPLVLQARDRRLEGAGARSPWSCPPPCTSTRRTTTTSAARRTSRTPCPRRRRTSSTASAAASGRPARDVRLRRAHDDRRRRATTR